MTVDANVLDSEYALTVLEDGPVAYWRLDEEDDIIAVNSGSLGASVDGTYTGTVVLENDSLLASEPDNPSILMEGFEEGEVRIPDSNMINNGGPYEARTVEVWFQAGIIDLERRGVLGGGGDRESGGLGKRVDFGCRRVIKKKTKKKQNKTFT